MRTLILGRLRPLLHGIVGGVAGSPLIALQWLARVAVEYGDPLRAGEVILSGAPGPMVVVAPGARRRAQGRTTKEIMRSLNRYITRQLFRTLAAAHPIPTTS